VVMPHEHAGRIGDDVVHCRRRYLRRRRGRDGVVGGGLGRGADGERRGRAAVGGGAIGVELGRIIARVCRPVAVEE
jgi:hypothetical protein